MQGDKLKIAIQKSGRLSVGSIELLRMADIRFDNGNGKLKSAAFDFPLEVLFLRDDDIPRYVEDGVADLGIVGTNVLAETGFDGESIQNLGFGRCRLALAVPRNFQYRSLDDLNSVRIATSYPNILGRFLKGRNIDAEIHSISGSVEIAPSIGLADAVCDLVSSGSTLFTNGLKEVETVMECEAVLISRSRVEDPIAEIVDSLLFRIRAVIAARCNKYILLNAPNSGLAEIARLLPGMKSPTIMPLAEPGWSSVHSVIDTADYWNVVSRLKAAGAEGILVISVDQMIR